MQFAEKIKSKSEFKAISKDKLKSVLICGGNNESVSSYLSFFDEYVNCDVVIASLTG